MEVVKARAWFCEVIVTTAVSPVSYKFSMAGPDPAIQSHEHRCSRRSPPFASLLDLLMRFAHRWRSFSEGGQAQGEEYRKIPMLSFLIPSLSRDEA